jgi:Caspase domain
MPGSPDTQPAPELPDERRLALVIATQSYQDPALRRLRSPGRDAQDLRGVLADPDIGGFTVTAVVDETAQTVRIAVGDFLADRRPDDLVLVYLSCHGLVDPRRRLYFAARDTTKERLAATGVEAQWLLDQLDECRARRQVLILDCCFSGAFATGAKGGDDLGLGERFLGQGRGRVVLTASRGSEYSFEGEPVPGQDVPGSVFTHALVDGINSGAADLDGDGYVSVDDAYGYTFERVRSSDAQQTPQRWLYGAEGTILLARNPAGITITPAELPAGIAASLDSPYLPVRLGGIDALAEWLADTDPARVLAARQALDQVAHNDRPEAANRARDHLTTRDPQNRPQAPTGRPEASTRHKEQTETASPDGTWRVWRRAPSRRARYSTLAAALVLAALLGVFLWTRQPLDTHRPDGTYNASGPWRFEVHDRISGNDNGCNVTITQDGSDNSWRWDGLYGRHSYQIPSAGTFRWTVSNPACQVVTRATPGDARLPAVFPAYQGDTDAFTATGQITAEVQDWQGGEICELTLKDPTATSQSSSVDIRTATKAEPSVVLDPSGRSPVYLAGLPCGVRVSE